MSSPSNNPLKHRGFQQHIYQAHATQKEKVGTVRNDGSGRQWIYCKNGAGALTPGLLVMQPDISADHQDETAPVIAVGETQLVLTVTAGTAVAADQLVGGFFGVTDGPGQGQHIPIIGNTAIDASGTEITVSLSDPIKIATTASSTFTLYPAKGYGAIASADEENFPLGVTPVSVPANYFFWAQRRGPALVLISGTVAVFDMVVPGATAGSVKTWPSWSTTTDPDMPFVGQAMEAGVDTEYHAIELRL